MVRPKSLLFLLSNNQLVTAPMTVQDDPWKIFDADFPSDGTLEERMQFLIGYATLAPSGHNTQPWLFATGPDWVDVLADRTRALPVVDPHDRELAISCGAAVGTFEVAARRFSLQTTVATSPDSDFSDHLVRIIVADGAQPDDSETALFNAIKSRRTDRSAYFMEELPDDLIPKCRDIVESVGVSVQFFEDGTSVETIAGLVAEGDRVQFDDPSFLRELASWVHSSRLGSRDGKSVTSLGVLDILTPAARFVIRTFDLGDNVTAADAKKILGRSPALALLASNSDTVDDWLNIGRALAKMLLKFTSVGYSASYLNQPIQVAALRLKLVEASGVAGYPQVLLRVGRSDENPEPSARRKVSDVILTLA
jgi:hypothetical protein